MATIEEIEKVRKTKGFSKGTFAFKLGLSRDLYEKVIRSEKDNLWITRQKLETI